MSESGIPNVDCSHKRVTHVHGTRACYVHDHCPCGPCRQANTAYANSRARQIAEATSTRTVPPSWTPARSATTSDR